MQLYLVLLVAPLALATNVDQCPGHNLPDLSARTRLTPCKKPPCRLKHNTKTNIELEFTPEGDVNNLVNEVRADVLGIPLPFPAVDGITVCDKIFLADEPNTKATCPLKAGTKYVYKDSFPVLPIYPTITTRIHWALKHGKKDVICFEVGAKIVR